MKYTFRNGARITKIEAQVVGEELDRIHKEHGALKPTSVVDEARPEEAALHPCFEWNDSVAAEEWRLHTARNLIRSVQVITPDNEQEPVYVSVNTENKEREYQPVSVVVKTPNLYAEAVFEAQQRINAAKKALEDLERAASSNNIESREIAAIRIAMQALATASGAVQALH